MGAQETAQQLRAFSDLVEDQTLVPNTHKEACNCHVQGTQHSTVVSAGFCTHVVHINHACTHTHT